MPARPLILPPVHAPACVLGPDGESPGRARPPAAHAPFPDKDVGPVQWRDCAPGRVEQLPFAAAVGAVLCTAPRSRTAHARATPPETACVGSTLRARLVGQTPEAKDPAVPRYVTAAFFISAGLGDAGTTLQRAVPVSVSDTLPIDAARTCRAPQRHGRPQAAYPLLEKAYAALQAAAESGPVYEEDAVQAVGAALFAVTGKLPITASLPDRAPRPARDAHAAWLHEALQCFDSAATLVLAPADAHHPRALLHAEVEGLCLDTPGGPQAVVAGTPLVVQSSSDGRVTLLDPLRLTDPAWYTADTAPNRAEAQLQELMAGPPSLTERLRRWWCGPTTLPVTRTQQVAAFLRAYPGESTFTLTVPQLLQLEHTVVACRVPPPQVFQTSLDGALLRAGLQVLQEVGLDGGPVERQALRDIALNAQWRPGRAGLFHLLHAGRPLTSCLRHGPTGLFTPVTFVSHGAGVEVRSLLAPSEPTTVIVHAHRLHLQAQASIDLPCTLAHRPPASYEAPPPTQGRRAHTPDVADSAPASSGCLT